MRTKFVSACEGAVLRIKAEAVKARPIRRNSPVAVSIALNMACSRAMGEALSPFPYMHIRAAEQKSKKHVQRCNVANLATNKL
jgi:hypothetical protein